MKVPVMLVDAPNTLIFHRLQRKLPNVHMLPVETVEQVAPSLYSVVQPPFLNREFRPILLVLMTQHFDQMWDSMRRVAADYLSLEMGIPLKVIDLDTLSADALAIELSIVVDQLTAAVYDRAA